MAAQGKRADIQGLRAIAVLTVLLYHAEATLMPGGFIGVDIFFVISGYLITGILLKPLAEGRFSIVDFYTRRVRRLFPALFTVLAFTLVLGLAFFPPALLMELIESQFFTTLFLSNFYFAEQTDYFDLQADLMPLLHTWSLGVEEQFYLLFPPILFVLWRWGRKLLWPILFVAAVASLWHSHNLLAQGETAAAFYSPLSRAFELLIGALCVGLERRVTLTAPIKAVLGGAGLAGLVISFLIIDARTVFPGLIALVPCLSTAALILARDSWANGFLSLRTLTPFGDISYSLYLWHWPLLVYANLLFPNTPLAVVMAVALSLGAATLSYRYIETPFLKPGTAPPLPPLRSGAIAMAVTVVLSLALYNTDGLPQRFSPEARAFLAASQDYNPDRPQCHMRSDGPKPYEDLCVYGADGARPGFAVWGDSHGTEIAMAFGNRLAAYGQSLKSMTMSGCPATYTRREICTSHNRAMLAAIKADPDMHTVLLTSNLHGHDDFALEAVAGVQYTARELAAAGKRVVIVYPIPTFDFDPPSMLALAVRSGGDPSAVGMDRALYEQRSGHIVDEFETFTAAVGLYGVPSAEIFCDEARCHAYDPEIGTLYYNQGHISLTGADLIADYLFANLPEFAGQEPGAGAQRP